MDPCQITMQLTKSNEEQFGGFGGLARYGLKMRSQNRNLVPLGISVDGIDSSIKIMYVKGQF
jgi:hypothetical protein